MRHVPLYHLSYDGDLPNLVEPIMPQYPNQRMRREMMSKTIPRLLVSDSILTALNNERFGYYRELSGSPLYIYSAKVEDLGRLLRPTRHLTDDVFETDEIWITGPGPIELTKIGMIVPLNVTDEVLCHGVDMVIKVDVDVNVGEGMVLPAISDSKLSIRGVRCRDRGIAKLTVNSRQVYVDHIHELEEGKASYIQTKDWAANALQCIEVGLMREMFVVREERGETKLVLEEPKTNAERDNWETVAFTIDQELCEWMKGNAEILKIRIREKAEMLLATMSQFDITGRFCIETDAGHPKYLTYLVYEVRR